MVLRAFRLVALGSLCAAGLPGSAQAQATDSTRARTSADSAKNASGPTKAAARAGGLPGRFIPPITPRRAFLLSAVLPGLGQSRLDRGSSGALFAAVELSALVMVRRSSADLREARRFRRDSLPATFVVSGERLISQGSFVTRYDEDLVRTRRLHVEDWLAVIGFNHLFAGADAFVAAQLWDVPVKLSAAPLRGGPLFMATIVF
ncbi:hypothetical protein [Gemmatimonas phototrophica]|uniref:DUF5683 domain-containing protein n=1 Tax=Gemmatimonas phototrophica TaxID=1379270 RepID=A0A143BIJ2_9BACT|nr:hypothetical protein [Gemmatimonas phototrophica]AMW04866.1 hypothetical protein GEMMAAP_08490 [Gemmatimonas phototrophica]